ncbi:MAG: 7-cyano-7-deazaguanine synthase QueC [Pseudomonadales bacterium]
MTIGVVLLSGGLDSATTLAIADEQGFECYALSFFYGQRNSIELEAARRIAATAGVKEYRVISIDLSAFGDSALTDTAIEVPEAPTAGIPVTYVPARNTVFLSLGLAWAEVLGARDLFIGVNAVDYSGYPDCRIEFIHAFEKLANLATRAGVEGACFTVHTPLIELSKADIIATGLRLGVNYANTVSCYQPNEDGASCGRCDSCRIRREGFQSAGAVDPTRYY